MGRRKKQLTQEQIDWRNSVLRGKIKSIVKAEKMPDVILTDDDKINTCFYYLNNCIFWINEWVIGKGQRYGIRNVIIHQKSKL